LTSFNVAQAPGFGLIGDDALCAAAVGTRVKPTMRAIRAFLSVERLQGEQKLFQ
jgi:hypothetical protein